MPRQADLGQMGMIDLVLQQSHRDYVLMWHHFKPECTLMIDPGPGAHSKNYMRGSADLRTVIDCGFLGCRGAQLTQRTRFHEGEFRIS
jgi:hypothetical protein